jgi:hypothetical protein
MKEAHLGVTTCDREENATAALARNIGIAAGSKETYD